MEQSVCVLLAANVYFEQLGQEAVLLTITVVNLRSSCKSQLVNREL